jgi:hypothetical protein
MTKAIRVISEQLILCFFRADAIQWNARLDRVESANRIDAVCPYNIQPNGGQQ